jgi:hypothetical protein
MLGVFIIEAGEWYVRLCFAAAMLLSKWSLSKTCAASLYCVQYRLGVAVLAIFVGGGRFQGWVLAFFVGGGLLQGGVREGEEGKELCTTLPTCYYMDQSHMHLNQTSRNRTYKIDSKGQSSGEKV